MKLKRWTGVAAAAALWGALGLPVAVAQTPQNQTPTTTPVSQNADVLPYEVELRRVDTTTELPTLQSFAFGQHDGLWVIVGGRTNGLHNFTTEPLKNFPPRRQNRRIYVIDPQTWRTWSRPLEDSRLTERQQDELAATAMEFAQVGDVLYVVGGYGYLREADAFTTFTALTALDLGTIVDWVRQAKSGPGAGDLREIVRQTRSPVLQVTGGQLALIHGRAALVFGQKFIGGYGDPAAVQTYTGQVRTFEIADDGDSVAIGNVANYPPSPNLSKYRRRDYNLFPIVELVDGRRTAGAVALSGVFTESGGVWTVPVEVDRDGRPTMADPSAAATFKQGMNSYNSATLALFDSRNGANHLISFGGISYQDYKGSQGFVNDANVPFINDSTAVVRRADGTYRQFLLASAKYPRVVDAGGARLLFGAEAGVFLDPAVPTTSNGLVDLRAALPAGGGERTLGWIYGGIAADKPNFGASSASNEVFAIVARRRS